MCPTLTRLVRSSWHGNEKGREQVEEEEDTRERREEDQGKELREVRRREVQPGWVRVNLCHQSQNLWQRRGRRVKEPKYKFCYFPEEQKEQGIVMGNPGGGEDGSPISVVSALRQTR